MPKGMSVHIGLNHVDAAAYGGWDAALISCVNDAHDLSTLAAAEGYRTTLLVDRQATARAILAVIRTAATRLKPGDIFLLTFAGHGAQLEDFTAPDFEPTGFDHAWVCWDRLLLDDELRAALAGFEAGVRVVVVADAGHSSTTMRHPLAPSPPVRTADGTRRARMMPATVASRDAVSRYPTYARSRQTARAELRRVMTRMSTLSRRESELRKNLSCLAARVALLAACQDNEIAYDGPDNGAFTAALLAVWNSGRFDGSYPDFASAIRARLVTQTPCYQATGLGDPAWEACRPFTIDITEDLAPLDDTDGAEVPAPR